MNKFMIALTLSMVLLISNITYTGHGSDIPNQTIDPSPDATPEKTPVIKSIPAPEENLDTKEIPDTRDIPDSENIKTTENMPDSEGIPETDTEPSNSEEPPHTQDTPNTGDANEEDDIHITQNMPETADIPDTQDHPDTENQPNTQDETGAEETLDFDDSPDTNDDPNWVEIPNTDDILNADDLTDVQNLLGIEQFPRFEEALFSDEENEAVQAFTLVGDFIDWGEVGTGKAAIIFTPVELASALDLGYSHFFIGIANEETTAPDGIYAYRNNLTLPGNEQLNNATLHFEQSFTIDEDLSNPLIVFDGNDPNHPQRRSKISMSDNHQIILRRDLIVQDALILPRGNGHQDTLSFFHLSGTYASAAQFRYISYMGGTLIDMPNTSSLILDNVDLEITVDAPAVTCGDLTFTGRNTIVQVEPSQSDTLYPVIVSGGSLTVSSNADVTILTSRYLLKTDANNIIVNINGSLDVSLRPVSGGTHSQTGNGGFTQTGGRLQRMNITGSLRLVKSNMDTTPGAIISTGLLGMDGGKLILEDFGSGDSALIDVTELIQIENDSIVTVNKTSQGSPSTIILCGNRIRVLGSTISIATPEGVRTATIIDCAVFNLLEGAKVSIDADSAQSGIHVSDRLLVEKNCVLSINIKNNMPGRIGGIVLPDSKGPVLGVNTDGSLYIDVPDMPALHFEGCSGTEGTAHGMFADPRRISLKSTRQLVDIGNNPGETRHVKFIITTTALNQWTSDRAVADFIWNQPDVIPYKIDILMEGDGRTSQTLNITANIVGSGALPDAVNKPLDARSLSLTDNNVRRITMGEYTLLTDITEENSGILTGKTAPDADISVLSYTDNPEHTDGMTLHPADITLDADGTFTAYVDVPRWPTSADAPYILSGSNGLWCYRAIDVSLRAKGISFYAVPDMHFGDQPIVPYRRKIAPLDILDPLEESAYAPWHIVILDDRDDPNSTWQLYVSLDDPLSTTGDEMRHTLPDALRFYPIGSQGFDDGTIIVPGAGPMMILNGKTSDRNEAFLIRSDAFWSPSEGIQLVLESSDGFHGMAYETTVTWTLVSALPEG